ncbi:MAG: hypothetical protein NC213_08275 [Acetobacter sp.]|nr:hypothetical protein [Bacteroides sp.]MCM1341725.1 hypothetical protein [Acetobacter sp.]MCM1432336.1 hypothetical protein [Clostridiales bacterium]
MKEANIVKHQLDKIGNSVYLQDGSWNSMPYKASISRLWKKKSSNFETIHTELGEALSVYYLYAGPYNHDITVLSDDAVLVYNDEKYEFKYKDAVKIKDETVYYSGVLRKIREADFDETV